MKKITFCSFILMIFLFTGTSLQAELKETGQKPILTALELWQLFQENQAEAENAHFGKTIIVRGIVKSTGMSKYLTPTVTLSDKEDGQSYVICVLPRVEFGKLSSFKKGQRAKMLGRIYRFSEEAVILKECSLTR